jgi:hypothetical protein
MAISIREVGTITRPMEKEIIRNKQVRRTLETGKTIISMDKVLKSGKTELATKEDMK